VLRWWTRCYKGGAFLGYPTATAARMSTHTSDRGHAPSVGAPAVSGRSAGIWGLTLGSIGVVFGDIGTSPLYAMREAVVAASPSGTI
jgi:hypothetical protein